MNATGLQQDGRMLAVRSWASNAGDIVPPEPRSGTAVDPLDGIGMYDHEPPKPLPATMLWNEWNERKRTALVDSLV